MRPATGLTLVLLAAVLSAVAIIPIPAMVDYVNHLARMTFLADSAPHARNWRCSYSFVYILGAPKPPPAGLKVVALGRRFVLYRIVAPSSCRS